MATLPTYFDGFLKDVRPTKNQRDDLKTGHTTLRTRLRADDGLSAVYVSDFLQGSYRRSTVVRPKGDSRSDVDIIVVTRMDKNEYAPEVAMGAFVPFLEKFYKDKWDWQGRSFGIELSYVKLDLVITAAPSEVQQGILSTKAVTTDEGLDEALDWRLVKGWVPVEERSLLRFADSITLQKSLTEPEWKVEPLWIPDRDAHRWDETHPLAQIAWTRDKNKNCSGYYLGTVQALKWWRRSFDAPKYPKGYPVEHLIGVCCPNGISSVAEGVVLSLEAMVREGAFYVATGTVPVLPDHGVPSHNVMGRVSAEDFAAFYKHVEGAATIAREAYDEPDTAQSALRWRDLFGNKFPEPPTQKGGFSPRDSVSTPLGSRFA